MENDQVMLGAWLGSWPGDDNRVVDDFEAKMGIELDLVDVYLDWSTPVANVTHAIEHISGTGALAILTWEAQTVTTRDILSGTRSMHLRDGRTLPLDDYVAEFADGVCKSTRKAGQPILLRVLHEMNGSWFAWGLTYEDSKGNRPNSPDSYKQAWVKLHDAFQSRCGDQVRFVWAVNHFSVGDGATFTNSYPGDAYVDFLGIDGYNWGTRADWGWQDFETIFKPGYCALATIPGKPILINEVASGEQGGDKPRWIHELFAHVDAYDRIRGVVWFNHEKFEIETGGTMDWNADSTPASTEAFRQGAQALLSQRDAGPSASAMAPAC